MSGSSRSPLVRPQGGMWSFLGFGGVVWLAISWSMLRLEPTDAARVAGPVILFGAVSEALRALADARVAVLHTTLAVLFTATGALLIIDGDSSLATPTALIGWYLLVRGAADIVLATTNRDTDRSWGLTVVLGVAQAALGFYAASSLARSTGALVMVLAGLALARAVADLAAAVELRDPPTTQVERERAAGAAGYAAGLADYAAAAASPSGQPRHRAPSLLASRPVGDLADVGFGYPGEDAHLADDQSGATHLVDPAASMHTTSLSDGTDLMDSMHRTDETEHFPAILYPVAAMATASHPAATMFTGPQPSPSQQSSLQPPSAQSSPTQTSSAQHSPAQSSSAQSSSAQMSSAQMSSAQMSSVVAGPAPLHGRTPAEPAFQSPPRDFPPRSPHLSEHSPHFPERSTHFSDEPGSSRHRMPAGPPAGMSIHGAPEPSLSGGYPGHAGPSQPGDAETGFDLTGLNLPGTSVGTERTATNRVETDRFGNDRGIGTTDRTGNDRTRDDRAGHDRAGHDRAGHDRAGNDRAGNDQAEAEQPAHEQSRTRRFRGKGAGRRQSV